MRDRSEQTGAEAPGFVPGHDAHRDNHALSAEARLAAGILNSRRKREQLFGPNFFADPAWDMLLDLFVQAESGNKVYVSSLCMASAVPTTTALRWIGTLTEAKLLERRPTGSNRKVEISLSRKARDMVRRHLRETMEDLGGICDEGLSRKR